MFVTGVDYIDPRKKGSTLESTLRDTVEMYILALHTDSVAVHKAVAQGFMHILEYCIVPKFGISLEKIEELVIAQLNTAISSGDDKVAQLGAIYCMYFLVKGSVEKKYTKLAKYLYERVLKIFIVSPLSTQSLLYRTTT